VTDRDKFILFGTAGGAVLGAILAWGYYRQQTTGLWTTQRVDGKTFIVQAGPMDFIRIGLSVFGILREIQSLSKTKKA
jgi:hypothetical protein